MLRFSRTPCDIYKKLSIHPIKFISGQKCAFDPSCSGNNSDLVLSQTHQENTVIKM